MTRNPRKTQMKSYQTCPTAPATGFTGAGICPTHTRSVFRRPFRLLQAIALGLLGVLPTHASTDLWNGSAGDMKWSTAANWTNGVPDATTDVYFQSIGAATDTYTINNIVDANTTVQSLTYIHDPVLALYHNTQIADGVTLTIANTAATTNLFVGTGTNTPSGWFTATTITGPNGSLVLNTPNGYMNVRNGGLTMYGGYAKLDMSGLGSFTANAYNLFFGGDGVNTAYGSGNYPKDRASANVLLAQTNVLVLQGSSAYPSGLVVGYAIGNGAPGSTLALGMTNAIFTDNGIIVGGPKSGTSLMSFQNFGSTAYFRNKAGTGPQGFWWIGDPAGYGNGAMNGTVDFTQGTIDAQVSSVVVGRSYLEANAGAACYGALKIARGTLYANTMTIGFDRVNGCPPILGTVDIGGYGPGDAATVIVTNSISLGRFLLANVAGPSQAILNIHDGASVTVYGSVTTSFSNPNNADSEINMNSGSLYVRGTVGPLQVLTLNQSTLSLDLANSPNPINPVCAATNLTTGAPVTLIVAGTGLLPGQFPLIKYQTWSGSEADLTLNAPTLQGYLSNNVANSSIDLVITNYSTSMVADAWNGNLSGDWDINLTANWKTSLGAATTYKETTPPGDVVVFDDTATGTTTVHLTTMLSPTAINVLNGTKPYTFTGSGALAGSANLYKNSAGTLTLANSTANTFTGPVTLAGGRLQLSGSADRLPTGATVTLADNASVVLDLNNQNQTLKAVVGGGASGGNINLGSGTLSVTAGSGTFSGVISGSGRLVKTNAGSLTLSGANTYSGGTFVGSNTTVTVNNTTGSGLGSGNIDIEGGNLYIGSGGAFGHVSAAAITNNLAVPTNALSSFLYLNRSDDYNFSSVLYGSGYMYLAYGPGRIILDHANYHSGQTTAGNGFLRVSHPNALGTGLALAGGGPGVTLELTNNITIANPIQLAGKSATWITSPNLFNLGGTNTLTGTIGFIPQNADWVIYSGAGKLVLTGPMTNLLGGAHNYWLGGDGDGEISQGVPVGAGTSPAFALWKVGAGTWTLQGANTFNSSIVVSNGTLTINGSTAGAIGSAQVYGGTLAGNGLIATPNIYIYNGGTLSPGNATNPIGTLTVTNNVRLIDVASVVVMDVSHAAYDRINGINEMNFGNGIVTINLAGPVQGGDVFHLFNAQSYIGTIGTTNLPALPSPLSWDASALATSGILRVIGPSIGSIVRTGDGNFQISGSFPGMADLTAYRVLAATNVSTPRASWLEIGSGTFTSGVFSFTDIHATNFPHRFYQVVTP